MVRLPILMLSMVLTQSVEAAPHLLLKGGQVLDGTGSAARSIDIEILPNGRIGRVEPEMTATGAHVRSIQGLVVAPGFIDVHTHAENILDQPGATNFVRMGVTSLVLGNCGSSKLDVAAFFRELESVRFTPNVATLIGHNTVRLDAMKGSFMRPPTPEELARMTNAVSVAMRAGALGLSTGLIYLPGTFARTEELISLAKVAAAHGGIYASHLRSEGARILEAVDELLEIARTAGIPAHVSHIKASGRPNWGRSGEILARLDQARAEGLPVTQDQYLYTASSTGISALIPQRHREGTRTDFRRRLKNQEFKSAMIAEMKKELSLKQETDYHYAVIAGWKKDPRLDGLPLPAAARLRRGSDSLEEQIELILEIHASGGASGVYHKMIESDLESFQRSPYTMFAADSSVREFGVGVPHPRGYGNNARVLSSTVRERRTLPLAEAIRRMTSLPARTFRLEDRGEIRSGAWADLVVFDPRTVRDRATYETPHAYAHGFRLVLVNGVKVVDTDEHTGTRPGRILRARQ